MISKPLSLAVLVLGWLPACGGSHPAAPAPAPVTGKAWPSVVSTHRGSASCKGEVTVHPGAKQLAEPVPGYRLGGPDEGNLCMGQVFEAQQEITLYRVYDGEKAGRLGSYWSFDAPTSTTTRQQYRAENAICESFNKLDRLVACKLRPGARFIVGPGQGIRCKESGDAYPPSPVNQVTLFSDPVTYRVIGLDEKDCQDMPLPWR